MKSDRRHELQENDLAIAMVQARDFLGQNARTITIAIGAVVLVAVLASFAMRSGSARREDQWRKLSQLDLATTQKAREAIPTLRALASEAADDTFRIAVLTNVGRQALRISQESDAPPDREMLGIARGAFEELLRRYNRSPLAFGTAHLGLATVAEDMFLLTRDEQYRAEARQHLSAVVEDPKVATLPLYRLAVDRRNALENTLTLVAFDLPSPSTSVIQMPTPAAQPPVDDGAFNAQITVQTPEGPKTITPTFDIKVPPGQAIPETPPSDEDTPEPEKEP